jgi:hypothetical protein
MLVRVPLGLVRIPWRVINFNYVNGTIIYNNLQD